ncbi:DUF2867 domain-containing protein [Phytoactinopolyspora limicola]|uniref:DUF2867 domain-containing protein n=1 Tax=Phytoactinopolyspora limicola TaxID=2715536 RepID=UPI001A9C513E|nr:DUF2867 domain-containing protein [Phytoactinopolyspora limicola]
MRNVHDRTINAPAEEVGALLDQLGSDDDPLFPSPAWLPMRFDRPLQVGADGGHGDVRYWVSAYEPGRRAEFTFRPVTGIDGYHELSVEPLDADRCVIRHVLEGRPRGLMRVLTPLIVRWLHDALVEDLFDNAELAATGRLESAAPWSPWVRLWRRQTEFSKPRAVEIPDTAVLALNAFDRVDFADAWQVPLMPGASTDPQVWADAIFHEPPGWVAALLRLRNGAVRLVGIEVADKSAFDPVERSDDEVMLGADAPHLDFRASVLVESETVTITTVTKIHSRRGRLYMAIVRRVHPRVVRSMLYRALRRLAERPKWTAANPTQSRAGAEHTR